METRCYFRRKSIVNRLVKRGLVDESASQIKKEGSNDPLNYGKFACYRDDGDPRRVFVKLISTTEKLPPLFNGLKLIEVSLHDKLWLEQNRHIVQGRGRNGKATFEVSFRQERYVSEPAPFQFEEEAVAFRDYADVWVRGPNLESVFDCYDKIRSGQTPPTNWSGSSQEQ